MMRCSTARCSACSAKRTPNGNPERDSDCPERRREPQDQGADAKERSHDLRHGAGGKRFIIGPPVKQRRSGQLPAGAAEVSAPLSGPARRCTRPFASRWASQEGRCKRGEKGQTRYR